MAARKKIKPINFVNDPRPLGETKPWKQFTRREQLFVLNYIKTGNITQSVKDAGYSVKNAESYGRDLMAKPHIKREVAARMNELYSPLISDGKEVLEYLTAVMRGQVKDQFGLDTPVSERTRAAVELAKRTIDVENKMAAQDNTVKITLDWGQLTAETDKETAKTEISFKPDLDTDDEDEDDEEDEVYD